MRRCGFGEWLSIHDWGRLGDRDVDVKASSGRADDYALHQILSMSFFYSFDDFGAGFSETPSV